MYFFIAMLLLWYKDTFIKVLVMGQGKRVKKSEELEFVVISDEIRFGKLIEHKRTHLGLSLIKTASLCGISDRTLRKLESGSEGVRLSTALRVAKQLGIKIKFEE